MSLLDQLKQKAKSNLRHIVLPEGTEPRTIMAAAIIQKEGLAKVTLIGNPNKISEIAKENNTNMEGIQIIDPYTSKLTEKYAEAYYEIRKNKGITKEKALETVKDEVYFGTMMVHLNEADGLVAGAEHTTGDTIRPALQTIKTKPGISIVSSSFVMIVPNCVYGDQGMFIFADCAVNPLPTAEQLAEIAISSAETATVLCGMKPKVALLSFSTMGSAEHEVVTKVQKALAIAKEKAPNLDIDGELQVDAAIVPKVGIKKAPNSKVAGKANVLVFPDLQSGNAGYKLTERLAGAAAIGPILQGLNKPVNDLSRGCSVEDIVNVVTITAVQAIK